MVYSNLQMIETDYFGLQFFTEDNTVSHSKLTSLLQLVAIVPSAASQRKVLKLRSMSFSIERCVVVDKDAS